MVLLEQLKTVSQIDLQEFIGSVNGLDYDKAINIGLKKVLGLWIEKPSKNEDVRCLCGKCLSDMKLNKDIIIRRKNPFDSSKFKCDKCDGTGYEYLIIEKARSRGGVNDR